MIRKFLYTLLLFCFSIAALAQSSRVQPAKTYNAGDVFYAAIYGLEMKMPDNYSGFLTPDTEVFSINIDSLPNLNIMMFPSKETIKDVKSRWAAGSTLAPGIEATTTSIREINATSLETDFTFSNNKSIKAYAYAQCSNTGSCYTIVISDQSNVNSEMSFVATALAKNISFSAPTLTNVNDDYNWKENLTSKYIFLYENGGETMRKNQLWLCADGKFKAVINRGGLLKNSTGKYKGKLKGTYFISGEGPEGTLLLDFKKLDPISLPLKIENDIIYINEIRHTVTAHQCK